MRNLIKKLIEKLTSFSSEELAQLYKKYKELDVSQASDFTGIINTVRDDFTLRRLSQKSGIEVIFDTEDFYKYLRGSFIQYHEIADVGLAIVDASLSRFPEYLPVKEYELNDENFRRVFPENFTPEMFKLGILGYIRKMDQVMKGKKDSSEYRNRWAKEGPFSGLKWLAGKAQEKKE